MVFINTAQKIKFSINFPADLVIFTEEILNGKFILFGAVQGYRIVSLFVPSSMKFLYAPHSQFLKIVN